MRVLRFDGAFASRVLKIDSSFAAEVFGGRAAAERLESEIGIEDRGALPGNRHPGSVSRQSEDPFMCRLRANFG